jgi:hypothetical protein
MPCTAMGAGTWRTLDGNGPESTLYGGTLPVSDVHIEHADTRSKVDGARPFYTSGFGVVGSP